MGVFDNVKCNHAMFAELQGEILQTKDFPDPWLEMYEITPEGRLVKPNYIIEDRGDKNATGIRRLGGMCTPVYDGTFRDLEFHGKLNVGDVVCKFTDGMLVAIER